MFTIAYSAFRYISSMAVGLAPFTDNDLPGVAALQPEGWGDILPAFQFYTRSDYCRPLKVVDEGEMVGVGSAIIHGRSAWLGHIIVSPTHRGHGIGALITTALVEIAKGANCETILLLATKLGEPVYSKVGFVAESSYTFFKGEPIAHATSPFISDYQQTHLDEILSLDRQTTGEDRSKIIIPNVGNGQVYVRNGRLNGYYLPSLGDGPIIATDDIVGHSLMAVRSNHETKFVLPSENESAITFLTTHGYQVVSEGRRMRLGKPLAWTPRNIYNRIAGNLG
jgi:GNAT superfamily N-acetyltransferase